MPDVSRSDSQRSDSSQRPRVSFNRDVRIKRIGRPEGSVVTAVTSDGEGHLVPTTVRRERGQGSRSQSAREAAIVLRNADSVNCIPLMDTSLRNSTIPKRNTKDPVNLIQINNKPRRKLTRSASDAGSRHDRSKYGPGKSYWSENEGEDSASSEGGRQKLRKQEEKKINIFATLNNRLRGKKKKKSSNLERSLFEDRRPNTPTRRNETGLDDSNLKSDKLKSKSIENLLPDTGGYREKKSQITQTSTLPRRSKNSKKQLSPIIEDEPIASNPRGSPFDFDNQDRRMKSIQDDTTLNPTPKIVIEPPTPIYEVDQKIFASSKEGSDQKDNRKSLSLMDMKSKDSRSIRRIEEDGGRKAVDKDDRGRSSSIRDYTKNEQDDNKLVTREVDDLSSRKDDKKRRSKSKAEAKSRSKFYDTEEWLSSEEDFSLAHDNGHYKSYDYGLLDPDVSLTNIDEINAKNDISGEGKNVEEKTHGESVKESESTFKGTVGRKSANEKEEGEDRLSNVKKSKLKRTSSLNLSPERRLFTGDNGRVDSIKNKIRTTEEEEVTKGGNNSQKKVEKRNSLSRRFFEKDKRSSLEGVGDKFDKRNATEDSRRKLVTSDEEENMSRRTVGMLVEELSRKQSANKRKENLQVDKLKSVGPLIDPLLDLDRQHNNNKPFSYTDPYKSPPPLLAAVSVDAKQAATAPTEEVIYAEVICTPAAKVGGNVGVQRAGHPSTPSAGLAATAEFGVSREPSSELATSIRSPRELVHHIRKETDASTPPKSHKTTVHTVVKRTTTSNPSGKLNEHDHSDTLPGKQPKIESNVNQNFRKTKTEFNVDLNQTTTDNSTNNYNNYSSPNSNRKSLGSDNSSSTNRERNSSLSETNSTAEYTNDYSIKSGRITKNDNNKRKKESSEVFSIDADSGKKVVSRKAYFVDDYNFTPIVEETRESSTFVEKNRHHQSSPSLYFSKSERDLPQEIRGEETEGKRESIIEIDVEREEFEDHHHSYGSKTLKMNTTRSMSSEKLLSGDINDLSLRRHRLESIIDSHKRRFENRAISPNRYSRTLTRSVSNVSPSYRNSNHLIEDDLSSATKKTIKEDRYFERHIKRTASNYKDKDMLSDGAPLKIEAGDSFRTNRIGRNNYKTYNYYLKNDSKNNEKFNNEYNLTNSIRDNKYRSSDNVADIYRNEEYNNESNGTKYGKKHFREWYTATSVKKTERGSGDETSYGYGSLKGGGEDAGRIKDDGRNGKALISDGKYPSLREESNRVASENGKDNRRSDSGRSSRGGFFEKLRNEQKSTSKTSSAKDSRKVSGLEKVRRKLSNWNSSKKNSTQDKAEKKDKKKKTKEEVHGSSLDEQKDPLTSRYSEYKGDESADDHTVRESDYYATRQRVSTPENHPTWFRSLDRIKHKTSHSRLSGEDTVDRKHRPVSRANSTSHKNLRFFGESDSGSYPSLNTSHLQVPSNRTSSRLRSSLALDSSAESTLEEDSGHSQKSVVYLHAATVGDIPGSRKLHRSQITAGRRSMSREELSSNKTDSTFVPHKRTLSRSISVLAPWRPRHPRDGIEELPENGFFYPDVNVILKDSNKNKDKMIVQKVVR
ncbi:J domain-containing protein DDB_G0295729 isoform X2 [Nilaparvata lugens]|uniref:J domain-containing protein DDB_G0295729 isoform X2 n=1 Tax=Nilaparvata lugens TaxID=108931 RepID=UPI00193CDDC6|nr:J domain-containing protein DDB_G0295729 isoform X2 [Nilaparvata lugens]